MTNPLLGKHISLISKKNIRYEGILYSINEQNATVALQNVKTFGTEGREKTEEGCVYVAATDTVHPYLLFRGQDIKDLHVHESQADPEKAPESEAASSSKSDPNSAVAASQPQTKSTSPLEVAPKNEGESKVETSNNSASDPPRQQPQRQTSGRGNRQQRQRNPKAAVGTGASLLNRSVRGATGSNLPEPPQGDFDFQSKLEEFQKEEENEEEDDAGDDPGAPAYAKDDFFDSISCDALDKQSGVDNRLRGGAERQLNTETFGATALNQQRRRRGGGRGYNGARGGRGGRSGGRSGRGGRGGRGRGRGQRNGRPQSSTVSS